MMEPIWDKIQGLCSPWQNYPKLPTKGLNPTLRQDFTNDNLVVIIDPLYKLSWNIKLLKYNWSDFTIFEEQAHISYVNIYFATVLSNVTFWGNSTVRWLATRHIMSSRQSLLLSANFWTVGSIFSNWVLNQTLDDSFYKLWTFISPTCYIGY